MSRIVCRMDWATGDESHIQDVIEFESRVNEIWRLYDDVVICTYHLEQLCGDAVFDIMRTHPLVIIGGHLQQNPDSCTQRSFSGNFGDGGLEEQIPSDGGPIWTINQGTQRLKSNAYSAV